MTRQKFIFHTRETENKHFKREVTDHSIPRAQNYLSVLSYNEMAQGA